MKTMSAVLAWLLVSVPVHADTTQWTPAKANTWYAQHRWLVGSNYIPTDAINQLEMWQADTFNPAQIDKELGWAEGIGMNTMRVFLHDLVWQQDQSLPVLAADTTVVLDGVIFGKPEDRGDALDMLGTLSGRTHEVLTAVALVTTAGITLCLSESQVRWREETLTSRGCATLSLPIPKTRLASAKLALRAFT